MQNCVFVNGARIEVTKAEYSLSLLEWLRIKANMLSVRSGCDGKKKCGVCIVDLEGQTIQSCTVPMHSVLGKNVTTVEGIPEPVRSILASVLLYKTNVPCGYCTAGLLVKIHILLKEHQEYSPSMLIEKLGFGSCTCIGVKQIIEAVLDAQERIKVQDSLPEQQYGGVPADAPRFGEKRIVFAERPFAEDVFPQAIQLYGVVLWSKESLFVVSSIEPSDAKKKQGVQSIITFHDMPVQKVQAPDGQEWRIFLQEGDVGYCESEVLGIVLATTKEEALKAKNAVNIQYDVYEPKTDVVEIIAESLNNVQAPVLHKTLHYGQPIESLLAEGVCTVNEVFYSKPSPYVPLENPCVFSMYVDGHIHIYTQVADIIWLKKTLAFILQIDESFVHCMRTETNIFFDAREDYLLALYAGIASYNTEQSVQFSMTHEEIETYRSQPIESIHDYTLLLSDTGELIGAKINIVVNGGAYTTDMMRVCDTLIKHATSGFLIRNVDISFMLVSTNTIPRYMPRGKCLESSCIVMNRLLDKLSKLTRFNRYEIRKKNILKAGDYTVVGEYLYGDTMTLELLERGKRFYDTQPSVSLSFSFIDTGLASTNAMCMVAIDVVHGGDIVIYHPYPDYGNGITTLIGQTVVGIVGKNNYNGITIRSTTDCMEAMQTIPESDAAMMYLVYHATQEATLQLRDAILAIDHHSKMWGKRYVGFSSISSEAVYSVTKEKKLQGNYTAMLHIARCDEPYIFTSLVVLVDAGTPFNNIFAQTLLEGGISVSFNSMVGSKDVGNQPIQTEVEFMYNRSSVIGYSFKGVYDASVVGLASSYYSFMWTNHKRNLVHYPLS